MRPTRRSRFTSFMSSISGYGGNLPAASNASRRQKIVESP
jgi:hypothetical protein